MTGWEGEKYLTYAYRRILTLFFRPQVVRQNTVQLIAYCAICCVNIAFAVTQVGEYVTWKRNLSQVQSDWNISFPLNEVDDARNYACGLIASLVVFMCLFLFLGYKLYLEFGWNIYKRIGADLRMQGER